ncbi:MAG: hypothetical protein NTV86_02000 [Planctomycetota bacterium]|nr:hypothetical protein [Planctomycetota bacterium]
MAEDIRSLMSPGGERDFYAGASADPGETVRASGGIPPGKKHAIVIGGMVVTALACVFALSRGAKGPGVADARQAQIELQVETAVKALDTVGKDDGKPPVRGADVAKSFYYQATERQVPISQLTGNPFVYKPPAAKPVVADPVRPVKPEPAPEDEPGQVTKLSLQSVLVGSQAPAAMISNNLLTRGQQINGWTLVEINPRSVVLERKGTTYVLTMAE